MSHPDEGVLHELLDGELAPEARAEVERHLAGCEGCRARLADARGERTEADAIVARLPLEPPLAERSLRPVVPPAPRRGLEYRWLGLAASALLVVTLGYAALRPRFTAPAPAPGSVATADKVSAPAAPAAEPAAPADVPAPERIARTAEPAQPAASTGAATAVAAADRAPLAQRVPAPAGTLAANEMPEVKRMVADTPPAKDERDQEQIELRDLPTRVPTVAPPAPLPKTRFRLDGLELVRSEPLPGGGTRLHYSVDATPVEFDQVPVGAPTPARDAGRNELRWEQERVQLVLRSALPPDELARLRDRVR